MTFVSPFGEPTEETVALAEQMMALAVRACPLAPEGFALGVVIGRLQQRGIGAVEVHRLVNVALGIQPLESLAPKQEVPS